MSNHADAVPEWLNAEYLEPFLAKSLRKPNLKINSIDIASGSKVGDNYVCRVLRILVKSNYEDLSIIAKCKPQGSKILETLKDDWDIVETECQFFKNLLPSLRYCISKEDNFAPFSYGVDDVRNVILMEDLSQQGYRLQQKGVFLNRDQCVLTVEAFAVMHGASYYALRDDPSLKQTFSKTLWNVEGNDMLEKCFVNAQTQFEKNISSYGLSSSHSKKLLAFWDKLKPNLNKVYDLREGRLNFIIHGDCWMNNMMYHFENNVADAVKLVDFQIVNYNCFANDLQHFLFSSARIDVILNDLDFILEKYFNKLKNVASDIPNLTLDRVKAEFSERYYLGYVFALAMRAFVGSSDAVSFDDVLDGKPVEMGFNSPEFISDLQKLLPFFERVGVF